MKNVLDSDIALFSEETDLRPSVGTVNTIAENSKLHHDNEAP